MSQKQGSIVKEEEKREDLASTKEFDKFRASVETLITSLRGDTELTVKRLESEISMLRKTSPDFHRSSEALMLEVELLKQE